MLHTLLSLALLVIAQVAPAQLPAPSSPSAPARAAAPVPQSVPASSTYKVGASDVLSIKVFNEDALTNKFVVDSDGTITFPLIGRVEVAGKTTREVEEHLTKLLQPDYVRRAQVS